MKNKKYAKDLHIIKIPLHYWILLKFKRNKIDCDITTINETEYKTIVYAKQLFGKIYIMRDEFYVDGKLKRCGKLKRVEKCNVGFDAQVWVDDAINCFKENHFND